MAEYLSILIGIIIPALAQVESSGGTDPNAYKPGRHAAGPLQITRACCLDVNRMYGWEYSWPQDCWNAELSERICRGYLEMYVRPDRHATKEEILKEMALVWHYGPSGSTRGDVNGYWEKVRKNLPEGVFK
jgi:hypothetical protein